MPRPRKAPPRPEDLRTIWEVPDALWDRIAPDLTPVFAAREYEKRRLIGECASWKSDSRACSLAFLLSSRYPSLARGSGGGYQPRRAPARSFVPRSLFRLAWAGLVCGL